MGGVREEEPGNVKEHDSPLSAVRSVAHVLSFPFQVIFSFLQKKKVLTTFEIPVDCSGTSPCHFRAS
jgi:hypothetical protein